MSLSRLRVGGGAAAASALRRSLGVLWLADALVKIVIPFGDRAADQWYGPIIMAMTGTLGLNRLLAWETNLLQGHPFLWWLPAAAELDLGTWLAAGPGAAGRPARGEPGRRG